MGMAVMKDGHKHNIFTVHKEKSHAKMAFYGTDRKKFSNKQNNYIDLHDSDSPQPGRLNVVIGLIVSGDVNVINYVRIGSGQMHGYETNWTQNFQRILKK